MTDMEIMTGETVAAVMRQTQAEVDMQVATAKRYPRQLSKCIADAKTMATQTPEVAASMFYTLPPRGKSRKPITGPSVRLAEVLCNTWGNIRAESKIIEEGEKYVKAQSTVWDMEKNVLMRTEVTRQIWSEKKGRYSQNQIGVTSQAAISIALRNAAFKVIPRSIITEVEMMARKVAIGDAQTIGARIAAAVEHFQKMGATEDRILDAFGARSVRDLGADELETMIGYANAIKEGQLSIDEAFPEPEPDPEPVQAQDQPASSTSRTAEVLDMMGGAPEPPPPPVDEPQMQMPTGAGYSFEELLERAAIANIPEKEFNAWCDELQISNRTRSQKKLTELADMIDGWEG